MKAATRPRKSHPGAFISVTLILPILMLMFGNTMAYVMPTEQLLYLMNANFSNIKTLIITQTTHLQNLSQGKETILNEKIWLKAPDLYDSELINALKKETVDNLVDPTQSAGDMVFRRLFMQNDLDETRDLLSHMGIDIEAVALTRFEGTIAYRLGDKTPESPNLLIEKDTFLPMALVYRRQHKSGLQIIHVRFEDYQETKNGWYPSEITYSSSDGWVERYTILDLEVNASIGQPLSKITIEAPPLYEITEESRSPIEDEPPEDERLRELINLLMKKY